MIDTHVHLLDRAFDGDREILLKKLEEEDFAVIENALSPVEWADAHRLAARFCNYFVSVGIHPHDAAGASEKDFELLKSHLRQEKVVAVGEMGLDYHYRDSTPDSQKKVFIRQIGIAEDFQKPLIVHCREAYKDCLEILLSRPGAAPRGVVHCFSGTPADAKKFIELGFYLGIDGPVTYPSAGNLREVVKEIPIEDMIVETDSPYLAPQKHRGKRNEPAYVRYVVEEIARIKGVPFKEAERITDENAQKLFGTLNHKS